MPTNTFGFEILQKAYRNELLKKEDVIILFFHWYIVKNGCRCIGTGDSKVYDVSAEGSELLPQGWNTGPNYALRYLKDQQLYVLLGVKSNMELLLNFVDYKKDNISNVMFLIEETVPMLFGPLKMIIPSYETILQNARKNFLTPLFSKTIKEAETQTIGSTSESASQVRQTEPATLLIARNRPTRELRPEHDPARVGARDLDPFARGGGMLFDPFLERPQQLFGPGTLGLPGRLPHGAIPPGARFDPIGPPDIDPMRPFSRRPGSDHFPPPRFDDMFM